MSTCILMRGVSGSGKSFLAHQLKSKNQDSVIVSADDYFKENGGFNWKKLGEAHKACQELFRCAIDNKTALVIVDNTNVDVKDMVPYYTYAKAANYDILLLEPETSWKYNAEECSKRTQHEVPLKTIKKTLARFVPEDEAVAKLEAMCSQSFSQ